MINKPELIESIKIKLSKNKRDVSVNDIEESFAYVVDFLTLSLKKRNRVEIRGFGVFDSKFRTKRQAINPKNKDTIDLKNRYSPSFKPSKFLNKELSTRLKSK